VEKTIVFKGKEYVFDAEDAQIEFITDLADTIDWPLYLQLHLAVYGDTIQTFFEKHVVNVLEAIDPPEGTELDFLRVYCRDYHGRDAFAHHGIQNPILF